MSGGGERGERGRPGGATPPVVLHAVKHIAWETEQGLQYDKAPTPGTFENLVFTN